MSRGAQEQTGWEYYEEYKELILVERENDNEIELSYLIPLHFRVMAAGKAFQSGKVAKIVDITTAEEFVVTPQEAARLLPKKLREIILEAGGSEPRAV